MFRHLSIFVFFFVVATLATDLSSRAQTAAPPAKSAEQLALQHGQDALKTGDLARARTEFEKAVQFAPNDAEAQSGLGWNAFASWGAAVTGAPWTELFARVRDRLLARIAPAVEQPSESPVTEDYTVFRVHQLGSLCVRAGLGRSSA